MNIKKPPMGYNTWNYYGNDIDEKAILDTADKMVELGLVDIGYNYLVIDDCWSKKQRDKETGKIVPNPEKFPHGMKYVSDYVHSKGMKFGMYSCAGTRTCANYPGSFDHEFLDARTFAEYGADFLKYDFCHKPREANGPLLYRRMCNALKASGRDIVFSACNWGSDEVEKWIRSTGTDLYRSTGDNCDDFAQIQNLFRSQVDKYAYSGPGCFNDIDMMTVGMYNKGNVARGGCTKTEYKTHFALWCMASTPLFIGCDLLNIDDYCLELLKNKDLLRINQDEECRPLFSLASDKNDDAQCYGKVLSNNEFAIMFVNFDDHERGFSFNLDSLGIPASSGYGLRMKNVFTNEDLGVVKEYLDGITLASHDCEVYLCTLEK